MNCTVEVCVHAETIQLIDAYAKTDCQNLTHLKLKV